MTSYAVNTLNAQNKVTATAADLNAPIEIKLGETVIDNESAAVWEVGENILTVKVTNGSASTTYTVTVTKE